ncbi:23S rRNA (guanosine(2251)-2'-O)-methyltransferase RlmB [Thermosulfurimonas marina]|uniref:23S rRNA (Guanosine(2251)-2'-O)-methyltransferase RlmB n=1 Tax=Thermosulfurimonas marina TaxID=2047767 RepID=A0A6H1WTX3_9BACT|nr:23S rRNA (guanosine(2251)-2'-O)-methyltransferase RlmB [Thermosulfurimonas marina]QJA06630.1 23S rRNA (guanosine(2251)-2'-O)-methyltransferase RlmB [Thermosulfurimonas marina]
MAEVVWGINPVLELLRSQPDRVEEIWIAAEGLRGRRARVLELARKLEIPVRVVKRFAPPKVPREASTQGVVAYIREFEYLDLESLLERLSSEKEPVVLFLDELTDPQNVGSLIRSAEALGAKGVVLPRHRACGVTPTVVKASAGAVFHLPVARVTNLRRAILRLREAGFRVLGLEARAERPLFEADLSGPLGLVVGSEGRGLRAGVREACDGLLSIPLSGRVESLNAAVAGALALYEVFRQRHVSGLSSG